MSEITSLEPRLVWEQFDAITRVPRPSKKEGKIIDFLVDFAKKHHIEYKKDAIGNVVMRKPATPGMEERAAVILQSHMDMVCEKNSDVEFDFDNDPIRTRIDGEWVRAEGTTLGADCGIGMAAALAVMLDETVEHGPVEALFTVDEETGLTGAFELGEGMLTGKYLVNLDSEDEGEIFIGCAGGIDTIATFHYTMEPSPKNYTFFRVDVSDLQGGHSGDDIDKGRVNSNKTVARLLWDGMQSFELKLCYFNGGNLRNAIPREAYAIFGVPARFKEEFVKRYNLFAADLEAEFRFREPNFKITLNEMPHVDEVLDSRTQSALLSRARRTSSASRTTKAWMTGGAPSSRRRAASVPARSRGRVTTTVLPCSGRGVNQSSLSLRVHTLPTMMSAGLFSPAARTCGARSETVATTLRWLPRVPFSMTAAGMSGAMCAESRPSMTCSSAVRPIRNTSVPPAFTRLSKSI